MGTQGSTLVRLTEIDEETLGSALTAAWRTVRTGGEGDAGGRGRGAPDADDRHGAGPKTRAARPAIR